MNLVITPGKLRYFLLGITGFLLAAHCIVNVGIHFFGKHKYWLDSLNMDRELNIPTLFSALLLFSISILMKKLYATSGRESPRDWLLLSRIFFFLGFDEAIQIHEIFIIPGFRQYLHPMLGSTWVIPYGLLAIFLAYHYRFFLKQLPRDTSVRLVAAGLIYIVGAIGMEIIGSHLIQTEIIKWQGFSYGMITGTEETLELLGLITAINALIIELIQREAPNKWSLTISKKKATYKDGLDI